MNNPVALPPSDEIGNNDVASPFLLALVKHLSLIGKEISPEDLLIGLPVTLDQFGIPDAKRALQHIGYSAKLEKRRTLPVNQLPILIQLEDGDFFSVVAVDGENFILAHPTIPGTRLTKPQSEVESQRIAEYLVAAPTIDALHVKHVGELRRGHWFWSYITSQKWISFEIFVATIVANILAVAVSLFALQVYDRVIPNASVQTLWVLAAGALVAIVFEATLRIARGRLIDDMGRQVELEVSSDLVSKLLGMRLNDRVMGPATLGSLMREFSSVREFFTATAMGSISDIPFVFIFLALIYFIAGPVVLVVITALVLIVLTSLFTRRSLSRISEDMQGANSAQSRLLNEITYGAEAIKLNRAENRFQAAWEDVVALISSKTQEQRATSAFLTFISQGISQIAYVSAVVVGVFMVFAGEFTVGAIIAVSILTTRTISPITQLSGAIARWQQVRVALDGLAAVADSPQERNVTRQYSRRDILHGEFDISELSFAYSEEESVVLNIQKLRVNAGETIAILGRNGSGKSTLLKILSGLYAFQTGEVSIDGLEIRQIDPVDLRRNVGVLTQDVTLFSGTLRENLSLGPNPVSEPEIEAALKFSGLSLLVDRHPMGMDMPVSDGGVGLSVGQRQSLGLSRIYLANPQIILLDEPTAAMDQTLEAEVIARMRDWLETKTCILTTHRTEIVSLCDRIAVLQDGRLALLGPRDEVISKLQRKDPS